MSGRGNHHPLVQTPAIPLFSHVSVAETLVNPATFHFFHTPPHRFLFPSTRIPVTYLRRPPRKKLCAHGRKYPDSFFLFFVLLLLGETSKSLPVGEATWSGRRAEKPLGSRTRRKMFLKAALGPQPETTLAATRSKRIFSNPTKRFPKRSSPPAAAARPCPALPTFSFKDSLHVTLTLSRLDNLQRGRQPQTVNVASKKKSNQS